MSAGCNYCFHTAWWTCRSCGAIMCDYCDPLHKCKVLKIAGEIVHVEDFTSHETQTLYELEQVHGKEN